MRSLLFYMNNLVWRLSYKDHTAGIPVAKLSPEGEERVRDIPKVVAALQLIQEVDPRRHQRLRREITGILLLGTRHLAAGEWYPPLRLIFLANDWVHDEATSSQAIASTLVHEATHARLTRFGYAESCRGRLERICYHQQALFAARLKDGSQLVAQARRGMDRDPGFYSTEHQHRVYLRALEKAGMPAVVIRIIDRWRRWRAA